jgi:hypothetical protein
MKGILWPTILSILWDYAQCGSESLQGIGGNELRD